MIKYISLVFIFLLISCSKENEKIKKNQNLFESNLQSKIDFLLDSTSCRGGFDRMIQIRHQKYDGKDFIQIASVYDFYPDSLYYCMEYKENFISIYNENFFKNKVEYNKSKKDSLLHKYQNLDFNNEMGVISDKRCFEIFEISKDKFQRVPHNSYYYNNLFADSFIPEPPPPPKNEK